MPCGIAVHVNSTDTKKKFTKLTMGDNFFFFVNYLKTDFGANLTNVLVAVDRSQMDGHVLHTRLIVYFVKNTQVSYCKHLHF